MSTMSITCPTAAGAPVARAPGQCIGTPHKARRDEQDIPVLGFHDPNVSELQLDDRDKSFTVGAKFIVAQCQKSKWVFSHVVLQKGINAERYAVERLTRDIQWLGHTLIILESDNERAILKCLLRSCRTYPN